MFYRINPLNAELNPICHLLALLGAHHTLHVSRIRVNNTIYKYNLIYMVTLQEHLNKYNIFKSRKYKICLTILITQFISIV